MSSKCFKKSTPMTSWLRGFGQIEQYWSMQWAMIHSFKRKSVFESSGIFTRYNKSLLLDLKCFILSQKPFPTTWVAVQSCSTVHFNPEERWLYLFASVCACLFKLVCLCLCKFAWQMHAFLSVFFRNSFLTFQWSSFLLFCAVSHILLLLNGWLLLVLSS